MINWKRQLLTHVLAGLLVGAATAQTPPPRGDSKSADSATEPDAALKTFVAQYVAAINTKNLEERDGNARRWFIRNASRK